MFQVLKYMFIICGVLRLRFSYIVLSLNIQSGKDAILWTKIVPYNSCAPHLTTLSILVYFVFYQKNKQV